MVAAEKEDPQDDATVIGASFVLGEKVDDDQRPTVKSDSGSSSVLFPYTDSQVPAGFSQKWTSMVHRIHRPILKALHGLTSASASSPGKKNFGSVFLSLLLFILAIFTRFELLDDGADAWTPTNSRPAIHSRWIDKESGFPQETRPFNLLLHADGQNMLGQESVRKAFEVIDAVRNLEDYDAICSASTNLKESEMPTCKIDAITHYWNHSADTFNNEIQSDGDAIHALSAKLYPDSTPVAELVTMGYPKRYGNGTLYSVLSYAMRIEFPQTSDANEFEETALGVILDIDNAWRADSGVAVAFRVEVQAVRSPADELNRAIVKDIPLVPIVFVLMALFTSLVFWKKDKVRSRSLLGFSAVFSVMLSIMSGFGLMILTGVPFTSLTPLLPFVLFGIGLDDAFIMAGAYDRSDPGKLVVDRIYDTIDDIGISITLSAITTTLAFGLGGTSSVPTIYWLCLYAFPTISFVYIYQLTFFVACIVLDEQRIREKRRDCCTWITAKDTNGGDSDIEVVREDWEEDLSKNASSMSEQCMLQYANFLLRPWVKVVVVVLFAGLFVAGALSASRLSQEFDPIKLLPDDSYMTSYLEALSVYTELAGIRNPPYAYFRFVDQSNETVQELMESYVNDMVSIKSINYPPEFFWLRDFKAFLNESGNALAQLEFNSQVDAFLSDSVYGELYRGDIVRDDSGTITTSRCLVPMDNLNLKDVKDQVDALEDQRAVTKMHPANQGLDDWAFFSYTDMYDPCEFYTRVVGELLWTAVIGVAAVTGIVALFIPHWSAALVVLPLICILYVDRWVSCNGPALM